MLKNLRRKGFAASTETDPVCTHILMFRKFTNNFVLVSIGQIAPLPFVLQGELAGLVAHPLLEIQSLGGHRRKRKSITCAHSINLINVFNRTDQSLAWSLSYAWGVCLLLSWRQTVKIPSILATAAVAAQLQSFLPNHSISKCLLTVRSILSPLPQVRLFIYLVKSVLLLISILI